MITKAYLVLSLSEIKRLHRAARAHRKASRGNKNHCVVLHLELTDDYLRGDVDGEQQVRSSSFNDAITVVERDAAIAWWIIEVLASTPAPNKPPSILRAESPSANP